MKLAAFTLLPNPQQINAEGLNAVWPILTNLINVALFAAGSLAIIFMIVGGLNYILSNGDPARITKAKNTLMYAVGGLVLALLALAIVGYVERFFPH
jgi:hypothetical protein